jgi:hypothetical protein
MVGSPLIRSGPQHKTRRWPGALRIFLLAGMLGCMASDAGAQVSGTDTLFYREVASMQISGALPGGATQLQFKQDGLIGMRAVRPGVAQAWFEQLNLTVESADGAARLPTDPVLGQLYVLHFDSAGHVTPARTPAFPEMLMAFVDLSKQFQDFFMPQPRKPLSRGLLWVDTLKVEGTHGLSRTVRTVRVGKYEVMGDSTIRGVAVFVVRGTVKQHSVTSGPAPGQPDVQAVNDLQGTDNARFYIAKSDMRMMARRSHGTVQGFIQYDGSPKRPASYKYVARIDLTAKGARPH